MSNEQGNTESEFDKAFNEATSEQEEPSEQAAKPDTSEEAGTGGEPVEQATSGEQEEDWRAKAEAAEKARAEAEQRMRSWEGRLKKSDAELEREREARQQMEQRLKSMEQRFQQGDRKKLEEWIQTYGEDEDFDHITSMVRERLEAQSDDTVKATVDTSKERIQHEHAAEQEAEQEAVVASHFSAIEAKHNDWREHVEKLPAWIETLPGKDALEYARILQAGNAQEVIAMLDAYKGAQKAASEPNKQTETDDADAMAAVRHRTSGRRPGGRADKNDFDAAWDEATRA